MKSKAIVLSLALLLCIGIACADTITTYSEKDVVVDLKQPISTQGNLNFTTNESNQTLFGDTIKISNEASTPRNVKITTTEADGIATSYVGYLQLSSKDVDFGHTPWNITNNMKATLRYTSVGDSFNVEVTSASGFNESEYTLIYYKDNSDRFNSPAKAIPITDVNSNLPYEDDWNIEQEADYCTSDNYEHCRGAKIWYVPTDSFDENGTIDWGKADKFLYETDLIWFFKNTNNEVVIQGNSYLEITPMFETETINDSVEVVTEVSPF